MILLLTSISKPFMTERTIKREAVERTTTAIDMNPRSDRKPCRRRDVKYRLAMKNSSDIYEFVSRMGLSASPGSGRIMGKNITSRMELLPVRSLTCLSIPNP